METIGIASTRPYYRRKLFFTTFAIVLLGALSVAAGLHALFPSALGSRYGDAIMTLRDIERSLVPRSAGLFAVMTGLLVLATAFLHLFYSHRIAGPAYRLGREADRIARGELKADFDLRRKDNLTDLADALKLAAHRYRETVNALDRHATGLEAGAATLKDLEHRNTDPAALASALQEMKTEFRAAEKLLAEIRT
ncbi:MAG: hypothetical protein OEW15_13445 [Nitrospirota bacterium]|nr:hypothetical protein [Nitrospirota bacterium]